MIEPDTLQQSVIVENLRAFTKLYGYTRFFHPSDEASAVDWEKFAIYGAGQVRNASGRDDLKRVLESLFLPIAPTMQIYGSDEKPPDISSQLLPGDTTGLKVVAWQHKGVGLGSARSKIYQSVRINRRTSGDGLDSGVIEQMISAVPYRGKEIKLIACVRANVTGERNHARLSLEIVLPRHTRGFFDNMEDRPITSPEWNEYQIVGTVAEDAVYIEFGGSLQGCGEAWLDDFQLLVDEGDGAWKPVPIENPCFEEGEPGGEPSEWDSIGACYSFKLMADEDRGKRSLRIARSGEERMIEGVLFEGHPSVGEVANKQLDRGLSAQIPLALYSERDHTIGHNDSYPFEPLESLLKEFDISTLTAEDEDLRLADVIIAWNVFQHFYPYFDVVDVDWNTILTSIVSEALTNTTTKDFSDTLNRMVAELCDGHAEANNPAIREARRGLAFRTQWIENHVVIVATAESTSFQRGDIVLSVDGVPVEQIIPQRETYLSGSSQWNHYRATAKLGWGEKGSQAHLEIERDGKRIELVASRDINEFVTEPRPASIAELEDGIYYVDLSVVEITDFEARITELSEANGVIFDLRGYPNSNHNVLSYLTDQPLRSAHWQVLQTIYPDRESPVGYNTSGRWWMSPKLPRLNGKIVFLTDGRAISYAESVLGIVEHYRLGEIIGQPTAGANGDVNLMTLPGGFTVYWTGMRVVKNDGSQHHLLGIQPTIPLNRTIQAVREGRDEYLEKGIEVIRQSQEYQV